MISAPETRPEIEITASDVTYRYSRKGAGGLSGFTLSVKGGVVGLVGPNGAGKTTFLKTVIGLLEPQSGTVSIGGRPSREAMATGGLGYLPETPLLPAYLTVQAFLRGVSLASPRASDPSTWSWSEDLKSLLEMRCSALSTGQAKRVALTAARLDGPSVIVLDEPTTGLDPSAVQRLRRELEAEKARGVTAIVSSHHLDELQRVADAIAFVKDGAVIGTVSRAESPGAFTDLDRRFAELFGDDDDA
ncbi:MAG: ATP-binding cassette domain-containing protein [Longimicrobiales bacterium]|nr:ATP-binding cassette domain-containing protein [Longimicrobiales bacterium]